MKIAVVGASGMLGRRMVKLLSDSGHEPLTTDLPGLDITDSRALENYFIQNPFDGLINCAAFTAVDACEDPAQYPAALSVNGTSVGDMAHLCQASGRWMIHISTDYVFNGGGKHPGRKRTGPTPSTPMAAASWWGNTCFTKPAAPDGSCARAGFTAPRESIS